MKTIDNVFKAQVEIKKSNFLAFLTPFDKFKAIHTELKEQHPKAVHIVWAYRHINKFNQIVENQTDDGEPKGTSGMPALNALRGAGLVNCAVFIVRYFGGIKLGTGGLVRAYSNATNLAINEAVLIDFEHKFISIFFVPFALISRFDHFFDRQNLSSFSREFNDSGVIWSASFKDDEFLKFYEFSYGFSMQGFEFLAIPLFAKELFLKENL